ncbi:MAG TPA: ATP-dependent DNA helicase RecG [Nitrospiraceae bacterium]|nr:ATP-dependent DNA helicase RecG [Nitrospiraceae bacterium]
MQPPTAPASTTEFKDILQRLSRPIEFAARNNYAHVHGVKSLGPFVCEQVLQALARGPHAVPVEISLLALRQLFQDFDQTSDAEERKRRVQRARMLLRQLASGRVEVAQAGTSSPPTTTPSTSHEPAGPRRPPWERAVQFLKGVGPKRAALLARLGIATVEDLLWSLPWRYEDRSRLTRINRLTPGTRGIICGTVRGTHLKKIPQRRLSILEVTVEDATGRLLALFFNQPYLEEQLAVGAPVLLLGRVVLGRRGWTDLRMEVEEYERIDSVDPAASINSTSPRTLHIGRIVPIYHETRGWTSRQMRVLIDQALHDSLADVVNILPRSIEARQGLKAMPDALQWVHRPVEPVRLEELDRGVSPAHRRLAFEELFLLELALADRHREVQREEKSLRSQAAPAMMQNLRSILPFRLTAAQERVIRDIFEDMASPHPMNRLLQGDVGSGKTVVALHALVAACASGHQAALMVPTELLAEQHYLNLQGLLDRLGLSCILLCGRERGKLRKERLEQIADGRAQVVIGTHALVQSNVRFARLGLVVIDEQHRFGVLQRKTLTEKGYQPDVLVLTATPIPRTLAMTVYGDLDVSVIDRLPPGRKPIRTLAFHPSQRRRAYQIVRDEIRAGRQAYVVYPLVEESEKVDLEAAMQAADRLQQEEFADYRVGLVYGRLKAEERTATMAAFKAGQIHVLVATTVIEVGVDVPNASVMVIEHAERFGLAQLHQLRGRVGRGAQQSYCLLLSGAAGSHMGSREAVGQPSDQVSPARQRLDALLRSTDGFVIAEEDLRIRGPGELFGTRQWGLPDFRVANLVRDAALLEQARKEAFALLQQDPRLSAPEHQPLREAMMRRWQAKLALGDVG